jgi:catechol 2,3-dioxygenase-like lactoylglutathione lyase family enzyme
MLVAGCGGDDNGGSGGGPSAEAESMPNLDQATGAPEKSQINVGAIPITDLTQLYVADDRGFFEDEGLEVEIRNFAGGAEIAPAVRGGSMDLGWSNSVSVIQAQAQGLDFTFFAGGRWERPPGDHPEAFVVADPEGHRVELLPAVDRSGERNADTGRRPVRVQHVTLATCAMAEMTRFYEDSLGFLISDRMEDVFTWLRGNTEHHTVALIKAGAPGIDHYSYDVDSWDDFKVWCDELAARGIRVAWGPGRHGPGNNLFIIFDDADGFRVELSAEMERYWDDRAEYAPRQWRARPETVNLWGPTPAWRDVAHAGQPAEGVPSA